MLVCCVVIPDTPPTHSLDRVGLALVAPGLGAYIHCSSSVVTLVCTPVPPSSLSLDEDLLLCNSLFCVLPFVHLYVDVQ